MNVAKSMPVSTQRATGIKVRISEVAARFIAWPAGWNVIGHEDALGLLNFCTDNGEADRRNAWGRGERRALQALAAQIRAAMRGRGVR